MVYLFLIIYALVLYSYMFDICYSFHSYLHNPLISYTLIILGLVLGSLVFFNFLMAWLIDPGYTDALELRIF